MTVNPRAGRRALDLALAGGLAFMLAACVADSGAGMVDGVAGGLAGPGFAAAPAAAVAPIVSDEAVEVAPPRRGVYDCGADGTITVEPMRSAVRLVDADGASYDLPASPPTQANRFGEGNAALVVEGREALWMKAGREPVECRR